MKTGKQLMSGMALLSLGQGASQAFIFLRNVVVVRALTKADYGLAATFLVSLSFFESWSNLNIERILVQAPDGDEPRFQNNAQLLRFAQGAIVAIIQFVTAPFLSFLFNAPEVTWAYRVLAFIPLLSGLIHFDPTRYHREFRYRPFVISQSGSQLASLLLVLALVHIVHDFTLVLWASLCQPLALTILTHLTAHRKYGWATDEAYLRKIIDFAWPLMLNGLVMFFVLQGDRLVIGSAEIIHWFVKEHLSHAWTVLRIYDKTDLAVYSVAYSICFMAMMFVGNTLGSLLLPLLSRAKDDSARFSSSYGFSAMILSLLGSAFAAGCILAGDSVVALIYSEKYRGVAGVIGWLGVMQGIRILRILPTQALLALADTKSILLGNIGRSLAIVGAIIATLLGEHLLWIAVSGVGGEMLAIAVGVVRLHTLHGVCARLMSQAAILMVGVVGCALALSAGQFVEGDVGRIALALAFCVVAAAVVVAREPRMVSELRSLLTGRTSSRS